METQDARLDVSVESLKMPENKKNMFNNNNEMSIQVFESDIEGEMTVTASKKQSRASPGSADFNTLDEPIKETFVSKKFHYLILTMSWQN